MKLKDSIIIILVFIVAVALGIFVGIKFTEEKPGDNDTNQGGIVDNNKENDEDVNFIVTTVDTVSDGSKMKEIYVNGVTTKITYLNDIRSEKLSYQKIKDVLLIDLELDNTHRLYFINNDVSMIQRIQPKGEFIRNISIKDNVLTISSDNIGNSGCAIDVENAKYIEELTYLGDFKFGELITINSVSAKEYNKSQGTICEPYV